MDLCEVAREAAEEYRAQAEAKGLTMTVEISEDACITNSDAGRVRQVLGNLISNAVKYTALGSVTVRVTRPFARTPESSAPAGGRVAVEVSDTGKGIPKEQLRHVFEEFVRLDPDGSPGAGIGLAMSRRITDALGGNITLRSDVGVGSTFTLWLPVDATPADVAAAWAHEGARQREMAGR
jgi:signal transduction histidine kinase